MTDPAHPPRAEEDTREPGQIAYEARFAETPPRCFAPWAELDDEARAVWVRVADAVAARASTAEARIAVLEAEVAALRADPARGAEGKEPPPGLLMSMAIRYDHALAMPGFYDGTPAGIGKPGSDPGGHRRRLENTLTIMRQLWEEVAGCGFYAPHKEDAYAATLGKLRALPIQGGGE